VGAYPAPELRTWRPAWKRIMSHAMQCGPTHTPLASVAGTKVSAHCGVRPRHTGQVVQVHSAAPSTPHPPRPAHGCPSTVDNRVPYDVPDLVCIVHVWVRGCAVSHVHNDGTHTCAVAPARRDRFGADRAQPQASSVAARRR